MIGYVKCFDDNNTMSFLADDKEFLKEYTKVWEKIRDLIGKKFDSEPVFGDKYIKTKIKSYNNDIRTNFHGEGNTRKVPKENWTLNEPLLPCDVLSNNTILLIFN